MNETRQRTRPVVLIECGDPGASITQTGAFVDRGFDVRVCPGPGELGHDRCELLRTERCHLVDGADVVFHDLDIDDPDDQQVLEALQLRYPRLPIVVEVPTSSALRHAELLQGCTVVPPISPDHVARTAMSGLL